MSVTIECPSRLHFGLLSRSAELSRQYGGIGMMVSEPRLKVVVEDAPALAFTGCCSSRAQSYAERFWQRMEDQLSVACSKNCRVHVEYSQREHTGLGTGTQLGLAVSQALSLFCFGKELDWADLLLASGRGRRSAIGLYGFVEGGLIVEGGKAAGELLSPRLLRVDVPEEWHILLIVPNALTGLHGNLEERVFDELEIPSATTDYLCRLVLMGILPALRAGDFCGFGEALYEFNCQAGRSFKHAQGGIYAAPFLEKLVQFLRKEGIQGVGQSSWGPAIFAFIDEAGRAEFLAKRLEDEFGLGANEMVLTRADNRGAVFGRQDRT